MNRGRVRRGVERGLDQLAVRDHAGHLHALVHAGGGVSDHDIEQLVYRLRRKLEDNPRRPCHLLTVRGLGYRLVAP